MAGFSLSQNPDSKETKPRRARFIGFGIAVSLKPGFSVAAGGRRNFVTRPAAAALDKTGRLRTGGDGHEPSLADDCFGATRSEFAFNG